MGVSKNKSINKEDWEFSVNFPIKVENFNEYISSVEFGYNILKYNLNLFTKEEIEAGVKLSAKLNKLPHGIIDKRVTGIGATTLEINSRRNSIIVMPTRALAYNKAISSTVKCCYVGGEFLGQTRAVSKEDILRYYKNPTLKYKKFLVVADSLSNLVLTIGTELFNNYFFMIDEIDMVQADSNFRPNLEKAMDYYFKFPMKSRCMLTATMNEFSNPKLVDECRFILSEYNIKRNVNLIHTNDINKKVKEEILKVKNSNILVAYNSIIEIRKLIASFDEELKKDCGILCSESSAKEAGKYYVYLNNNLSLPKRIIFMTCTYFVGIDIFDKYQLITVSNPQRYYQVLSHSKMTQIAGRCRLPDGLLKETIIYKTRDKKVIKKEFTYGIEILKTAERVVEVIKELDYITKKDKQLQRIYSLLKEGMASKAFELVQGEKISLIRKINENNEYAPAYLNIDNVMSKYWLNNHYYKRPNELREYFNKTHNLMNFEDKQYEVEETDEYGDIVKAEFAELHDEIIKEVITTIKNHEQNGTLNMNLLDKLKKDSNKNCKQFYNRFIQLYDYIDSNVIIDLLWGIRGKNNKSFNGIKNAVVFHLLESSHPFKLAVLNSFEASKTYTALEIQELLAPIIKYHLFKDVKPRQYISLLRSFYMLARPRKDYKVVALNPLNLPISKRLISADENLIRHFKM